jgi:thermostable 8-oxoguanine DNA glycosylase
MTHSLMREKQAGRRSGIGGQRMQTMYGFINGALRQLDLPDPDEMVIPGIRWGVFDELLTPAYWRGQAWQHEMIGTYARLRLGRNLVEEVAACLLGGFGMKAEIGLAAFARLRDRGLLLGTPSMSELESALAEPFSIRGASRRYRFPRQKARYLSACLKRLETFSEPLDDAAFRDRLAELPGIGLKTASWIVRNYRGSNRVAVIDVHILRAGRHIDLFSPDLEPQRHYRALEESFLRFAAAIGVAAGMLDGLIWDYMRRTISTPARASRKLGDDRQQPELFAIERAVSPYAGAQHPIMS